MPEALARTRHDSVLSGEARPGRRAARQGVVAATLRRLRALPARGYAGAALAAVLTGIVLNALTLQHQRHPAPFFAAPRPALEAPPGAGGQGARADAPRRAAAGAAGRSRVRRRSLGRRARRRRDRRDLARGSRQRGAKAGPGGAERADQARLLPRRPTERLDAATSAALRDFERAHSLPASIDVTPRLLKQLNAAANASGR